MNPPFDTGEPSSIVRPVVFIGLDGAEPELLRRWMDDGTLPVLARLRRDGICESVATFPGFGDGATWPSLVTGVNPARHGRYFRSQFRPRSYRRKDFSVDTDLERTPFWTSLSEAGRRVAVLDLPYARWEAGLNGLLLVDWLIHDRYGSPRSWPREFAREVLERFGDDPVGGNSDVFPKDRASLQRLLELLQQRVRMKASLLIETLATEPWDLVATAFAEAHDLGHVAWHLHDSGHPQHDADWLRQHGDPIKSLYVEIDGAIGRILDAAPPKAAVVVFAGLGMGPNYTANEVLGEILARLDGREYRPAYRLTKRSKAAGFPELITRICGKVDTAREILTLSGGRFFGMSHNDNSGAIRINLAGREPAGRVSSAAYDAVCDELTEAFMEIKNSATGTPIVERVVRVGRELEGEHLDTMPDLLVVWSRESPFCAIESPRIGTINDVRSWGRTGDHTAGALLMVHGEGIRARHLQRKPSIVDIAATIGALQGVALPNIDGRPIDGLCRA
jgi:predicted AlkP superfamily phosphohydrolase/phosphomutase